METQHISSIFERKSSASAAALDYHVYRQWYPIYTSAFLKLLKTFLKENRSNLLSTKPDVFISKLILCDCDAFSIFIISEGGKER